MALGRLPLHRVRPRLERAASPPESQSSRANGKAAASAAPDRAGASGSALPSRGYAAAPASAAPDRAGASGSALPSRGYAAAPASAAPDRAGASGSALPSRGYAAAGNRRLSNRGRRLESQARNSHSLPAGARLLLPRHSRGSGAERSVAADFPERRRQAYRLRLRALL